MAELPISFRLLETLTSALYEDPIMLFREYVQNSLDAYNDEVNRDKAKAMADFSVNINIDKDNFNIEIVDNGYGIREEEFLTKMTTIGESGKKKIEDQIGFRGIGRLSAMPLCKQLVFENKPKGTDKRLIFTWDGERFNDLLDKGGDIEATLDRITNNSSEDYDGDPNEHYFKVKIEGYQEAIEDILSSDNFKDRLCTLLPLRYSPEFTGKNQIRNGYYTFMGQSLDKFSCPVKLDQTDLYKPYTDKDILASEIVFWDLIFPGKEKKDPGAKIGILWFTFDRVIETRPKGRPYGILVRSMNMLMGDQYTLAFDASRSKSDYITTRGQLNQALNGVCGEMLINYDKLKDNARRDWFQVNEESIKLRHIIVEFMRRLHEYRYAASDYKNKNASEERLITAFKGLVTKYDPDKFLPDIKKLEREIEASKEVFDYAEDDIPKHNLMIKRFYELMMKSLHEYFLGREKITEFHEIRTHIKNYFKEIKS